MLILVEIDLSNADLALFDAYEAQVLVLLSGYGANLIERLRSTDGMAEFHLLEFPNETALDAFRSDPVRASLQELWDRCGATSTLTPVTQYGLPDG